VFYVFAILSLCTRGGTVFSDLKKQLKMDLQQNNIFCASAGEDVQIFLEGALLECGKIISVIPSCPDSGSCVFTVNTSGTFDFILQNTSHITLSVKAFTTPESCFFPAKHLSVRSSYRAQKQKRSTWSSGAAASGVKLCKTAVLRL
jgi:hypothetical protein